MLCGIMQSQPVWAVEHLAANSTMTSVSGDALGFIVSEFEFGKIIVEIVGILALRYVLFGFCFLRRMLAGIMQPQTVCSAECLVADTTMMMVDRNFAWLIINLLCRGDLDFF